MKSLVFISLLVCALSAGASQKAVTEEGEIVILNSDGTWYYEDGKSASEAEIMVNDGNFSVPSTANFTLKSTVSSATFTINSKKWKFNKNDPNNGDAEYSFQVKNGDLYALAITEQVEIDLESLAEIAFENAKGAAPDMRVIKKEYRTVNGQKVIYMEMVGTIQSIKFQYLGYYHSNQYGSTQYLTYTGQNLVPQYRSEIDDFLNGFSVAKN